MERRLNVLMIVGLIIMSLTVVAWAQKTFEDEFALSVRAGRGELSEQEKQGLTQEKHPILMQIGDPNTFKLIELFANLSDELHAELKDKGYLKWEFGTLNGSIQKVYEDVVQLQIDMVKQQGMQPQPGFSLEELKSAEVGFVIVEIPSLKQKVVSWYILWPTLSSPTWVTVVNGRLAGTPEYFQVHMQRLPSLKNEPASKMPE